MASVPIKAPPTPRPAPVPKTGTIHGESYPLISIEGNRYAKVHQRVESAHKNGGYSMVSCEFKKILDIEVCEVWIELPNQQRFIGTAEINRRADKPLAKAQTRALGRALAFAGFNVETAIASDEEMEDAMVARGTTVVESTVTRLPAPAPVKEADPNARQPGEDWRTWCKRLGKRLGTFDTIADYYKLMAEVTKHPNPQGVINDEAVWKTWEAYLLHEIDLVEGLKEEDEGMARMAGIDDSGDDKTIEAGS